jgi:predicted DNA-binding ribbon-helix-helix protein
MEVLSKEFTRIDSVSVRRGGYVTSERLECLLWT